MYEVVSKCQVTTSAPWICFCHVCLKDAKEFGS